MSFERFIAMRYLFARRKQAFISVISLISILGVAIGVASLIVVLGVMNGMSTDLRDKILGVNAHLLVGSVDNSIADYRMLTETALTVEGVTGVMPFLYSEVMLSTRHGVKGVVLRGINPADAANVLTLDKDMLEGKLAHLTGGYGPSGGPPGIVLGKELAQRLGVRRGSLVNMLTPSGMTTAAGFKPKVQTVRVVAVFKTGMYEYDASLAYVSIPTAQRLMGFKTDTVSGLELKVDDVDRADEIGQLLKDKVGGFPLYVRNWKEMNENLYAALALEKLAISVILVMIVLVGSFSIVTTLVMLVMEKTRDIAILMSMGATRKSVRAIFMLQGMIIGVAGTVAGFALGLTLCFLLQRFQFITLPKGIYSLDYLPVLLEWPDLVAIGVSALVLCFLATVYPARQASKLTPAEALRYE
ncbi:lipoprotein-releasing ABC transporter permease subunit [Desulfovibrio ferrophilus]|uniref:Lipoprotein releasing system transmembrane protein LolC/E family n=1 Tax=Desulfovibrio ferrophilus TaxID=241368 RepID=A0A2Z6AUZ9_9BACT|nr:lipoprotein-releasing ABC transporter permease subunit [Desulfovibrio ferrophilus]BBD07053.1 lipoprotein releasing system transmembrane protein LolC/E family [Desulfovibrio ferrophilus]